MPSAACRVRITAGQTDLQVALGKDAGRAQKLDQSLLYIRTRIYQRRNNKTKLAEDSATALRPEPAPQNANKPHAANNMGPGSTRSPRTRNVRKILMAKARYIAIRRLDALNRPFLF